MDQVAWFLLEMRKIVETRGFLLVPREESQQFLADANMTISQLQAVLMELSPRDCFDGPERDRDPKYYKWTVAEFKPLFRGVSLYLKVSINMEKRRCKCLSVKLWQGQGGKNDNAQH